MKKHFNLEEKIVFLSNTLGSFVLGFYFSGLKTIGGYVVGAFCIFNIFCFISCLKEK